MESLSQLLWGLLMLWVSVSRGEIVLTQSPALVSVSPGERVIISCKASQTVTNSKGYIHSPTMVPTETWTVSSATHLRGFQPGLWSPCPLQWQWCWEGFLPHNKQCGGIFRWGSLLLFSKILLSSHSVTALNKNLRRPGLTAQEGPAASSSSSLQPLLGGLFRCRISGANVIKGTRGSGERPRSESSCSEVSCSFSATSRIIKEGTTGSDWVSPHNPLGLRHSPIPTSFDFLLSKK